MQDFQDLECWRKAHGLAMDGYQSTESLPKVEVFGLTVQLRRAAVAIPTRIAEGCGRESNVEMASHLNKARGHTSELEYLLLLCRDLGYIAPEAHDRLRECVVAVRKMLSGLVKRL